MKSYFSDAQWDWVAEKIREGYPQSDIARFLGVHRETVRRAMIRHGKKPERRADLPPLDGMRQKFIALGKGVR